MYIIQSLMPTKPEKGSRFLRNCGELKKSEKQLTILIFWVEWKFRENFPFFFHWFFYCNRGLSPHITQTNKECSHQWKQQQLKMETIFQQLTKIEMIGQQLTNLEIVGPWLLFSQGNMQMSLFLQSHVYWWQIFRWSLKVTYMFWHLNLCVYDGE